MRQSSAQAQAGEIMRVQAKPDCGAFSDRARCIRISVVGEDPMVVSRSGRRWFCLPSRLALILGMGALSTTGAQAEMADRNELNSSDGTLVRAEAGRIYLTEGGRETELRLSASPERDHLLRLLQEHGSAGVKLDRDPRLIMSGGGGTG